jgi:hypothetical protein
MRNANDSDPPSLLMGDDYFRPAIGNELKRWAKSAKGRPASEAGRARKLDLFISVTTIKGDPVFAVDDFGQRIGEQKYNHSLTFTHEDFADDEWVDKLAIAARTSASIPFVF